MATNYVNTLIGAAICFRAIHTSYICIIVALIFKGTAGGVLVYTGAQPIYTPMSFVNTDAVKMP